MINKKDKKIEPNKLESQPKFSGKYFEAVGRRKTAIARVRVYNDKKKQIIINDKDYKEFLPSVELVQTVESPLKAVGKLDYSVSVRVSGGGLRGQAEAIRHGLARALLKMDAALRPTLKPLGFLTRDARKKERKKPGLKRARRAPQWSKR